jgi:hypothetical protein
MPDPTTDRIIILAQSGVTVRQAEATIGRPMTQAERLAWDRAQVKRQLEKAARKARGPKSVADRVHQHHAQHSMVEWRDCADPKRRAKLEADRPAWLRYYFEGVFFRPFEEPHLAIINGSTEAIKSGGRFAVAAERGIGKSVIEWALAVIDAFSGTSPFPAYVPWQASAVKRAFRFWKNALCFNPLLLADYPEFCAPFAHSRGVSQRLAATVWKGGPNDGKATGAQLAICDGMIILPDSRGCIGSATINGNPRGLNHPTPDGRVLRPTSAILDDVQDRDVAKSAAQIMDTIAIIDGDVAGMGEAGAKLPMLMTGNCIAPGDVMAHYLAAENWHSIRVPCVLEWPEGWDDGNGPTAKMWEVWHELYKRKGKHRQYYKANRSALTKGFRLSAPGVYAGKREFPDAFCGVMESYYRMGKEAFHAEKQQKPLDPQTEAAVRVTPEQVMTRAIGPARGVAPDGTIRILAAADINPGTTSRLGARITWACAGFGLNQTEGIMAYGIHQLAMPADPTPSQQVSVIYAGLNELRMKLAQDYQCTRLGYDARGWYTKGVTRGQALRYPRVPLPNCTCAAIGMEGWSGDKYSPKHKCAIRQFEGCYLGRDRVEQQTVEWLAWDTDWHNLQQMRAWLATPGAPGACMLYTGNHSSEFMQQVTTRAFMGMVQKSRGQQYDWVRAPGSDDYGDCLAMLRALAAAEGISSGGEVTGAKRQRKTFSQADYGRP